nr:MAG TPA: hypothetical protein [Caudoviricetes sp.]
MIGVVYRTRVRPIAVVVGWRDAIGGPLCVWRLGGYRLIALCRRPHVGGARHSFGPVF